MPLKKNNKNKKQAYDGQFGHLCSGPLERTVLRGAICVLLNGELFSRNTSPWLLLLVNFSDQ